MTAILLDTHVLHWWSAEPARVSPSAVVALENADELAVSAITWFELAWLARHERIALAIPVHSWLEQLSRQVRTIALTPAVAEVAVSLQSSFPGDPADRLIYASAVETGLALVTKDQKMHSCMPMAVTCIW